VLVPLFLAPVAGAAVAGAPGARDPDGRGADARQPDAPAPDLREPHVVLTRRRSDLRHHAGEISFPGGRQDPDDVDLKDTALREAEEEIGLPREIVSLVGELPAIPTFATNYLIHPFVGVIPAAQRWRASPLEVDAVLELTLEAIRQGSTRTRLERRGISFETDAYIVDEHLIWGATARILRDLLERLDSLMPAISASAAG
jgi:8-oxo-dGTP pyrophosphatase MutT (NUDIX family)